MLLFVFRCLFIVLMLSFLFCFFFTVFFNSFLAFFVFSFFFRPFRAFVFFVVIVHFFFCSVSKSIHTVNLVCDCFECVFG